MYDEWGEVEDFHRADPLDESTSGSGSSLIELLANIRLSDPDQNLRRMDFDPTPLRESDRSVWYEDPFVLDSSGLSGDLQPESDAKLVAERDEPSHPVGDIDVVHDEDEEDEDLPLPGYPHSGSGSGGQPGNDGGGSGGGDPPPPPGDDDCDYEERRAALLNEIADHMRRAAELYALAGDIARGIVAMINSTAGVPSQQGDGETGYELAIDFQWLRYYNTMAEARMFQQWAADHRAELERLRPCGS